MGALAIIDTLLIYKIVERVYNNKTCGFFASILFAVMPATWLTRWIHLDSIQLPFLLGSILLALLVTKNKEHNRNLWMISLSGILLGISIFTKVPAFTMIPLIVYLLYSQKKSIRIIAVWLIPVILIPSSWPMYAIHAGEFDQWIQGINTQLNREGWPLLLALQDLLIIDPVLLVLGIIGSVYALFRRDLFLILFTYPYLIFLFFINFVSNFHLLLLIVSFCISISKLIIDLVNKKRAFTEYRWHVISALVVFGLINSTMVIVSGDNSPHFNALRYIYEFTSQNTSKATTSTFASPFYVFYPKYDPYSGNFKFWTSDDRFNNPKILQVLDREFKNTINQDPGSSSYPRIYEEFHIKKLKNFTNTNKDRVDVILIDLGQKKQNQNDVKIIDLSRQKWNADKNVSIFPNDGELTTMIVNSLDVKERINKISSNVLINTTRQPLLLLNYSSNSFSEKGNALFFIEIRDELNTVVWRQGLKYTSDNFSIELFKLPDNIRMKTVKIIFELVSQGVGKQTLVIANGTIF